MPDPGAGGGGDEGGGGDTALPQLEHLSMRSLVLLYVLIAVEIERRRAQYVM